MKSLRVGPRVVHPAEDQPASCESSGTPLPLQKFACRQTGWLAATLVTMDCAYAVVRDFLPQLEFSTEQPFGIGDYYPRTSRHPHHRCAGDRFLRLPCPRDSPTGRAQPCQGGLRRLAVAPLSGCASDKYGVASKRSFGIGQPISRAWARVCRQKHGLTQTGSHPQIGGLEHARRCWKEPNATCLT